MTAAAQRTDAIGRWRGALDELDATVSTIKRPDPRSEDAYRMVGARMSEKAAKLTPNLTPAERARLIKIERSYAAYYDKFCRPFVEPGTSPKEFTPLGGQPIKSGYVEDILANYIQAYREAIA